MKNYKHTHAIPYKKFNKEIFMESDMTFCAYRKCQNTDCLRFHSNAPRNRPCSWFAVRPKDDGTCLYFIPKNEEEE